MKLSALRINQTNSSSLQNTLLSMFFKKCSGVYAKVQQWKTDPSEVKYHVLLADSGISTRAGQKKKTDSNHELI